MNHLVLLSSLLILALSSNVNWRNCAFCQKIIGDTEDYYGPSIVNVTDVEFVEYFDTACRRYVYDSPIMSDVCLQIIEKYPEALFKGLREDEPPATMCQQFHYC